MSVSSEALPPGPPSSCLNCGTPLAGRYCARCGQDHRHGRLKLLHHFADLFDAVTSIESRVLRTVAGLTLRPGQVARDFVAGRRIGYVGPVRYAIATCALWWSAVLLVRVVLQKSLHLPDTPLPWFVEYGQPINLACVPLLALPVWLSFANSRYNYAETLAFMTFTTGHVFLWRAALAVVPLLALTPLQSLVLSRRWAIALNNFDRVAFVAYTTWALWYFHQGRVRLLLFRVVVAIALLLMTNSYIIGRTIRWLNLKLGHG